MSSASGKAASPMTPEAKLASRRWRSANSWWIFVPLLSLGLLGWLGFLVAAIRTRKRSYWISTGVYAVLSIAFFTMIQFKGGVVSNLAVVPFLGSWLAPTIHAAVVNRDYLRTIAAKGAWYEAPAGTDPDTQATPASVLGVSDADYYGSGPPVQTAQERPSSPVAQAKTPTSHWDQPPAPQGHQWQPRPALPEQQPQPPSQPQPSSPVIVDINTADADVLTKHLGVDLALADHIVTTRMARGGYHDLDDLVRSANLQPHHVVRIRNRVSFTAQTERPPSTGSTGRILDL